MAHHDNRNRKEDPVARQFLLTQPEKREEDFGNNLQQRGISVDRLYNRVCHDDRKRRGHQLSK